MDLYAERVVQIYCIVSAYSMKGYVDSLVQDWRYSRNPL